MTAPTDSRSGGTFCRRPRSTERRIGRARSPNCRRHSGRQRTGAIGATCWSWRLSLGPEHLTSRDCGGRLVTSGARPKLRSGSWSHRRRRSFHRLRCGRSRRPAGRPRPRPEQARGVARSRPCGLTREFAPSAAIAVPGSLAWAHRLRGSRSGAATPRRLSVPGRDEAVLVTAGRAMTTSIPKGRLRLLLAAWVTWFWRRGTRRGSWAATNPGVAHPGVRAPAGTRRSWRRHPRHWQRNLHLNPPA
jgi:hypothetical protein